MTRSKLVPNDEDLQEIFALFSSPSDEELRQVYDHANPHFHKLEDLQEEYALTQEKREFAEDAWRAIMFFLHKRGFRLTKEGIEFDLNASSGYGGWPRD
jgi:hypothetical protein